jgi:sterol desaturase/sphingolipid hydroxylase (fatty acid hydroxylase superfamily)
MEEWLASAASDWLMTALWIAGLSVIFGVLVRLMPCNPGMYWWTDLRAVATDFMYWFVVPLFVRIIRAQILLVGARLLFSGGNPNLLPVAHLPAWQQVALMLAIQEVMLYWIHRLFHGRLLWGIHAIHHSPEVLDWTATGRFHPLNSLLEFGLADTTVILLGFSSESLQVLFIFNLLYSAMVHANLNWTFGPLRYVLASPVFHRWHHTTEEAGLNKNFASTFPILDLVFGTFYMPAGTLPANFGTGDTEFPEGFLGQLLYPLRRVRLTQPRTFTAPALKAVSRGEPRSRRPGRRALVAR